MVKVLRHGFTTGACAAAAAKGAALLLREQAHVGAVTIELPAGFAATFALHGQRFDVDSAVCCVVKDAGDDPDVTNGCEVWAEVRLTPPAFGHPPLVKRGDHSPRPAPPGGEGANDKSAESIPPPSMGGGEGEGGGRVEIAGGTGIGRVTKPGLAVPPGEWAINPVPRRMIAAAVREVLPQGDVTVTISIPDGAERSRRTLNERLGILGGLSILGTTGVVKPISAKAWTDTLDAALDVAKACGCETVVLSTGRTSEIVAQQLLAQQLLAKGTGQMAKGVNPSPIALGPVPVLSEESFVMMGDHVGYALRAVAARGFATVVLAGQFAKLLKIACGHEQTHVTSSELDLRTLAAWLQEEPALAHLAGRAAAANTAREVLEISGCDARLVALVAARTQRCGAALAPGVEIKVLLAGYGGEVLYFR